LRAGAFDDVQSRFGHGATFWLLHSMRDWSRSGLDCDAAAPGVIEWDCRRRDGLALLLVPRQESNVVSAAEWSAAAFARQQIVEGVYF
jgi:hypothetical protein